MKKKTLLILIVSIIALVGLLSFIIYENFSLGTPSKMEYSQKMFASDDSSTVKKVFIADMAGNTVLLQRGGEGGWQLDDGNNALRQHGKNRPWLTPSSIQCPAPAWPWRPS